MPPLCLVSTIYFWFTTFVPDKERLNRWTIQMSNRTNRTRKYHWNGCQNDSSLVEMPHRDLFYIHSLKMARLWKCQNPMSQTVTGSATKWNNEMCASGCHSNEIMLFKQETLWSSGCTINCTTVVRFICLNDLNDQHRLRNWFATYSAWSHYMNQFYV